jgi:hypothetical protein
MSANPPSFIQFKNWNFLITDAPSSNALDPFIKLLRSHNVHHVVRACDPSYEVEKLKKKKIEVHVCNNYLYFFFFYFGRFSLIFQLLFF